MAVKWSNDVLLPPYILLYSLNATLQWFFLLTWVDANIWAFLYMYVCMYVYIHVHVCSYRRPYFCLGSLPLWHSGKASLCRIANMKNFFWLFFVLQRKPQLTEWANIGSQGEKRSICLAQLCVGSRSRGERSQVETRTTAYKSCVELLFWCCIVATTALHSEGRGRFHDFRKIPMYDETRQQ